MANTVISLRSSGISSNTPSLGVLANGELSLNFADGILYYKSAANTLGSIRTTQVAGLNKEIQFNDSGSFGSNASLTFDKANTTLTTNNFVANTITTGTGAGGIIAGANVIYSNIFVANSTTTSTSNSTGAIISNGGLGVKGNVYADAVYDGGIEVISFANQAFTQANSANVLAQAAFNQANSALSNTNLNVSGTLRALNQGGDEGGEIFLDKPVTNTSLAAGITIDVFQNKLRIFETGGSVRGVFIDIANSAAGGVGTDLLNPASTPDTVARTTANAAFDKANSANVLAQAGFDKANTSNTLAQAAFDKANTANVTADAAFDKANTANTTADASFSKANTANVLAQAAFDSSNTKFATAGGTVSGDVTVSGNLTVVGQTVYANTQTVLIKDNIITLNAAIDQAASPTSNAGIEIDRGLSANASLIWDETNDKWVFSSDGTTYYGIADAGRLDSSFTHANGAFDKANSANVLAQAAFNQANTDVTTISATAGVYGNATIVPVITLAANGRISSITNTAISGGSSPVTISTFNITANGTTLSYDLGFNPVAADAIFVTIDGVVQPESTYTVNTTSNTITFGAEPANTENVRVVAFASTNPYILADGSIDPSKLSVSTNNFITATALDASVALAIALG